MVAPAAVPAWYEISSPAVLAVAPSTALVTSRAGIRRVSRLAVAGGATSRPNTMSVPTARNEATTARVTSPSRTAWARAGRMPSAAALSRLNDRASSGRWKAATPAMVSTAAPASSHRSPLPMPRMEPNSRAVRSPA